MFTGGLGDVRSGFFAFEPNGENLAGRHAIEGETGADEGHGAEIGGNIKLVVDDLLVVLCGVGELGQIGSRHGLTGLSSC